MLIDVTVPSSLELRPEEEVLTCLLQTASSVGGIEKTGLEIYYEGFFNFDIQENTRLVPPFNCSINTELSFQRWLGKIAVRNIGQAVVLSDIRFKTHANQDFS